MIYNKSGSNNKFPEAMSIILLAIIEATPCGGLTFEQLREVYETVTGKHPNKRVIYRIIRRLNEAIDPNAYDYSPLPIQSLVRGRNKRYYTYQRNTDNYVYMKLFGGANYEVPISEDAIITSCEEH